LHTFSTLISGPVEGSETTSIQKAMTAKQCVQKEILKTVANQLAANDPPEAKQTYDRLLAEGYSDEEARKLIACAVTAELFAVMKYQKPSDPERYVRYLDELPGLPGD
jgi:regulator of protease activity HflC (stomatin/prohibitin superfamily)